MARRRNRLLKRGPRRTVRRLHVCRREVRQCRVRVVERPVGHGRQLPPDGPRTQEENAMPYSLVWMSKYLTVGSRILKDLAVRLEAAAAALRGMRAPGVRPNPAGDTDNGFPLPTTD